MYDKIVMLILGAAALCSLGSLYLSQPKTTSIDEMKLIESSLSRFDDFKELQVRIKLFKDWAAEHGKDYSAVEASQRFMIWNDNYEFVQETNAKNLSYTVEMNKFADLATEEFAALYLGFNAAAISEKDNEENLEILDESDLDLDLGVDWRDKGAVTYVKNQQQCGACYAFASCAALEGYRKVIKKKSLVSLSPQQIADCSSSYGNNGCNGGLMTYAFSYTRDKGIEKWDDYPFQGSTGSCKHTSSKSLFKNKGYKSVGSSYKQFKSAVKKHPVAVAVEASGQSFQMYSGGIFSSSSCGTNLDHAITAVGYSGSSYWIVKNSWGSSWGEKGYIRIKMGSQNSGAGVCGINSQASYPT